MRRHFSPDKAENAALSESASHPPRVGFIIDSAVPSLAAVLARRAWPHHLLLGWNTHSTMAEMRYGWVAEEVNRGGALDYELFRPWRRYAAVVFVKSFSPECLALARTLRSCGTRVIFEINVDYFTPPSGEFFYDGMAPSDRQCGHAREMAQIADVVIAASQHIADAGMPLNANVHWIPDNVRLELSPPLRFQPLSEKPSLWWSGESLKLFELLAAEEALRKHRDKFRLRVVTSSLTALSRWKDGLRPRFEALLGVLDHEIIPFSSVRDLLARYGSGGFIFSPRFLENTYNLGHTEWKLTLGMACGLPALCSPAPSYETLAQRAGADAVRVCGNSADWDVALGDAFGGSWGNPAAARQVVKTHYSSEQIAPQHAAVLKQMVA